MVYENHFIIPFELIEAVRRNTKVSKKNEMKEKILHHSEAELLGKHADMLLLNNPGLGEKIQVALDDENIDSKEALCEALKFMHLAAGSESVLTPSHKVDLVWHELILFTRTYSKYCDKQFGQYLHHQPDDDKEKNKRQFYHTLKLYILKYGTPSSFYWGELAENMSDNLCGNCES